MPYGDPNIAFAVNLQFNQSSKDERYTSFFLIKQILLFGNVALLFSFLFQQVVWVQLFTKQFTRKHFALTDTKEREEKKGEGE